MPSPVFEIASIKDADAGAEEMRLENQANQALKNAKNTMVENIIQAVAQTPFFIVEFFILNSYRLLPVE
jgi:hypothetical protein